MVQDRWQVGGEQDSGGIALVKTKSPPRSSGSHLTVTTVDSESNDSTTSSSSSSSSDDGGYHLPQSSPTEPLVPGDVEGGHNPHSNGRRLWGNKNSNGRSRKNNNKNNKNPLRELVMPDKQNRAVLMLNLVAVIWGSQHAVIKTVVTDSDPAAFTFLRFGLAGLVASPYLPGFRSLLGWLVGTLKTAFRSKSSPGGGRNNNNSNSNTVGFAASAEEDDEPGEGDHDCCGLGYDCRKKGIAARFWKPWRWGIEMGFWMFLGFAFQAIGMQTTTAQRSGFLLYLNVKFVPFFAYLLLGRHISLGTLVSALAAFSGTAMLAFGGGGGGGETGGGGNNAGGGIHAGDLWSIAAAAASAMFILRLEVASASVPRSSELNAASLAAVAGFSGLWWLLGGAGGAAVPSSSANPGANPMAIAVAHPFALVYLAVVSTALANLLQTKAQRDVPAERASVVYSLDPVYGAVFSWAILGETLGGALAYAGASIIFVAAAANSLAAITTHTKHNTTRAEAPFDSQPPEATSSTATTLFSPEAVTASNR